MQALELINTVAFRLNLLGEGEALTNSESQQILTALSQILTSWGRNPVSALTDVVDVEPKQERTLIMKVMADIHHGFNASLPASFKASVKGKPYIDSEENFAEFQLKLGSGVR